MYLKRSFIILLTQLILFSSANAQSISINVKNTEVITIIKSILNQHKKDLFNLNYENSSLDVYLNQKINFKVHKVSINTALDSLLFNYPISYLIIQNNITLKYDPTTKKRKSIPSILISGVVINKEEELLDGASIYIHQHKKSYSTDEKGNFKFDIPKLPAMLEVSYVGYEPITVHIKDSSFQNIQLTRKEEELDLLINTGYIREAKDRFTGRVSSLTAEEISQNSNPDILQNIAIQIPGMIQHFNFDPTNNIPQYQIRGRTTIHANPNPLIILDQIPYQSNTMNIHPEDIARVDVLKDAAAAAIWGARSGNGVIVFTTKEGKLNNKAKITGAFSSGITSKKDLFADDILSSSEVIDLELRLFGQNYFDRFYNTNKFPILSPVVELKYAERFGAKSSEEVNKAIDVYRQYDIRNDIKNHLQRNASFQQMNVQLIGGGNQNTYFFSVGNLRQQHELPNKYSNRLTVNSKNRFLPINGVEIGNHIIFTDWRHELPHDPTANVNNMIQYAPWADANGTPLTVPLDYRQSLKDSMVQRFGFRDWNYYPLLEHQHNKEVQYKTEILFQLNAKVDLLKNLQLAMIYNFNYGHHQDVHRIEEKSYAYRNMYNTFAWVEDDEIKSIIPPGQIKNEGITNDKAQTYRYTLSYNFNIPKWHLKSTIIVGGEARKRSINYNNELKFGIQSNRTTETSIDTEPLYPAINKTFITQLYIQKNKSYTLNENYYSEFLLLTNRWKEHLIIETNLRRDASNLFGENTNKSFVPLWSVGTKFNLESITKFPAFNNTHFNINYGKTGNIEAKTSPLLLFNNRISAIGNIENSQVFKPSDPNLKWETSGNLNIGLNKYFEIPKINISIDIYKNHSKDLVINKKINSISGVENAWTNDGKLKSKGVEIAINKNFKINNKLNIQNYIYYNYNKSEIIHYQTAEKAKSELLRKPVSDINDRELYSIYATKWLGVDFDDGRVILPNAYNNIEDFMMEIGLNNLNKIGNLLPKSNFRFISKLQFNQNLELSFNISYSGIFVSKNKINENNFNSNSLISHQNKLLKRIVDNVKDNRLIQSLNASNLIYLNNSAENYYSSSIIKLDNITFTYITGKKQKLKISINGNNIIKFYRKNTLINNFNRTNINFNIKYSL